MSSEVLVSKSPFIFGRFEWDTEIPLPTPIPQGEWVMITSKIVEIIGQDNSENKIQVSIIECHRASINDLRPFKIIFYTNKTNKAMKGNVHVEMKMSTKNAKPKTLIYLNSRSTQTPLCKSTRFYHEKNLGLEFTWDKEI